MWEVPLWLVVAALAIPTALLAATVVVAVTRRGRPSSLFESSSAIADRWAFLAVAVAALAGAAAGLPWPVLLAAVALNATFGRAENVPFSRFTMFSQPPSSSWYIRVERFDGEALRLRRMGTNSTVVKKKFRTEFRRHKGPTLTDPGEIAAAQSAAGESVADWLDKRLKRPRDDEGRRIAGTFTVVLVDVHIRDGDIEMTRHVVAERGQR